ncbi:hypothetical protein BCR44DRAFT_1437004 [Catenaria anguillulae PL171]|uniref:Uncharacterized protein n=1 Tax=Catenaria anguillulae PL171 TaxID=765915 RepID=A0A1Y2HJN1_9FUNG|nr:hypothetical protein BCR44DRAFT_1437004 [Catenaria anguillulae PL171]
MYMDTTCNSLASQTVACPAAQIPVSIRSESASMAKHISDTPRPPPNRIAHLANSSLGYARPIMRQHPLQCLSCINRLTIRCLASRSGCGHRHTR